MSLIWSLKVQWLLRDNAVFPLQHWVQSVETCNLLLSIALCVCASGTGVNIIISIHRYVWNIASHCIFVYILKLIACSFSASSLAITLSPVFVGDAPTMHEDAGMHTNHSFWLHKYLYSWKYLQILMCRRLDSGRAVGAECECRWSAALWCGGKWKVKWYIMEMKRVSLSTVNWAITAGVLWQVLHSPSVSSWLWRQRPWLTGWSCCWRGWSTTSRATTSAYRQR